MKGRPIRPYVVLVPDRFAVYRLTVFRELSLPEKNNFSLVVYADTESDLPSLKIVSKKFCDMDLANGGVRWKRIRNFTFRGICFWQSGLLRLATGPRDRILIYWGEANRISTWLSALLYRIRGGQVIFWTHGLYGNEGVIKLFVRKLFYKIPNSLLVYSDYSNRLLQSHGFDGSRLHTIKNSLDLGKQERVYRTIQSRESARTRYAKDGGVLLTFIGRLRKEKKLDLLIKSILPLEKTLGETVSVLIIGEGPFEASLRQIAEESGVQGRVTFFGACYDEETLGPLLNASDLCVSPGEVGLTAMHSLVYGTPVVTHDNFGRQMPEFEAIVERVSGAFFQFNSLPSLVSKIIQCIQDLRSGTITSESCRKVVLTFYSAEFQRKVFNKAINDLIASR